MSTTGVRQILVTLDARPESLAAVERSANLAAELGAELAALFVEDSEMLRVCQLPVVEVSLRGGHLRRPERVTLERELRARAAEARRVLERAAGRRQLAWSFRITRGRVHDETMRAEQEACFVTAPPGRRTTRRVPAIAAVLGMGEAGDRALALAARLAHARSAELLVLAPLDGQTGHEAAARIAAIAGAQSHPRMIACEDGAAALGAVLDALEADLLVLPADTPGLTAGVLERLCTAAGCDLMLLGAAVASDDDAAHEPADGTTKR